MNPSFPVLNNGATVLQSYNNEMVKCIEDLCSRRDELKRQIDADQEERAKLHHDVKLLTNRLAALNEGIGQKMASQSEFDKAISETQVAYSRVMQSSQALLQSLHGAASNLRAKEAASDPETSGKLQKFSKKVQIKGFN